MSAKAGRGKSQKSIDLVNAVREILSDIQPATVRGVGYQSFIAGLITDMSKNSINKLSKQLVWARESGIIPWEWIVDEGRVMERASQWDNTDERIECAVMSYRRDNWQDQPYRIEVWSEKGTIRGPIQPVLDWFGVGFRVVHGFCGASVMHDAAEDSLRIEKPTIILYVGDYDPSGLYMSEVDLPKRMSRYCGKAEIRRVAIIQSDTIEKDANDKSKLPSFSVETKIKDPRYQWYKTNYGDECWELDALSPVILRERLESSIRCYLDHDAWNHARKIEKAEIQAMECYKDRWMQAISHHASKCLEATIFDSMGMY